MNDYIDAVCEGSPLEPPTYNDEIEQWELYFEESPTAWHPYDERDLISVSFDSKEQAQQTYDYYREEENVKS